MPTQECRVRNAGVDRTQPVCPCEWLTKTNNLGHMFPVAKRIHNFSAGPSALPTLVVERARDEMLSYAGLGMGVMEMSHRSKEFESILHSTETGIGDLLGLTDEFKVVFVSSGATLQFSMVPMNFLYNGGFAEYIVTGTWSEKAVAEAKLCGKVNLVYDSRPSGYRTVPRQGEIKLSSEASYVHYTSNETIDGVEFDYDLDGGDVPVVCDASSNILSRQFDMDRYSLIYAGAQKNIGPSGITVVIIRNELLDRVPKGLPSLLDYRNIAKHGSMPNTPNTWGIYLIGLVCDWLKDQGGVQAMERANIAKARLLYEAIDSSDGFYVGHAVREARSRMNVTFRLPSDELDELFCSEAEQNGMSGLRGHRSVGGIRASIYNAMPIEGVEHLVEFMSLFAEKYR